MGSKPKDDKVEKTGKKEEDKPKAKDSIRKQEVRRELVRLANTDLDATKSLRIALTGIKGISYAMSKAICGIANFDPSTKLNTLSEKDRENLENIIYDPVKFGLPAWFLNRRTAFDTGETSHPIGNDLIVVKKFDIQRMVDLKIWKGVRHMYGMPVRGQRTRSSFKKGKTVGVVRKAVRMQSGQGAAAPADKKEEKK